MALTATATDRVVKSIQTSVGMNDCKIVTMDLNRHNLEYHVLRRKAGDYTTAS